MISMDQDRKYKFSWDLIGDIKEGRSKIMRPIDLYNGPYLVQSLSFKVQFIKVPGIPIYH